MKSFFKTLTKDSVLLWSFWLSIIAIIFSVISILVFYPNLPPVLPLYNHMPWGYARLGKTYELFILPFLSLCILITNSLLGSNIHAKVPLLARFLFITSVSLNFFTFIFIVRLIFITL